ncbi:UDP-N-acetylmuramate--L-alanine ligase [Desulfurobacterium indicum]|uniref:UDP-N-acetylmuramate--L-alanine ligase n=1 Tax=Desulfurobacterium indicum TaxID=1914305 RepID=A0A1R1MJN0_9BACT|nr:UDP-N-acetylmuramate--L-alanine ligase [Desulfurobacterium indicum]OMH39973.1 UDP-N-acetylmuramate--L-alanine ligase [Desulfurobacterium indicum]
MFKFSVKRIHFIGIGGIGISGLAYLFKKEGYDVSGSDIRESETTRFLEKEGINVYIGHRKENVKDADVVIYTSAAKRSNPEIVAALEKGIPVVPRCDALSELMRFKEGIAVAGTHGKTTTSSMISKVFYDDGFDPTILVGGKLDFLGFRNAYYGKSDIMIAETDESDGTFLKILPSVSVITNIDTDHLDFYKDIETIKRSFIEFANRVSFYGKVFLCGECRNVRDIFSKIYKKKLIYGFSRDFDLCACNVVQDGLSIRFDVLFKGKFEGNIFLPVPGKHNVLNALAAVGVSLEAGIPFTKIAESLSTFKNAKRRAEIKGEEAGVIVIDDYGHHPTEIENTYKGIREAYPDKKVLVLFQPHRYTRTKLLWDEFTQVLSGIDNLFITDIYPAGEEPIDDISAKKLADLCGAVYVGDVENAVSSILPLLEPDTVLLTLGAGNVYLAGEKILQILKKSRGI